MFRVLRQVASAWTRPTVIAALTLVLLMMTAGMSRAQGAWDLIWRNSGTGEVYNWNLSGSGISNSGDVSSGVDNTWKIVAQVDLFNDGGASLIWENSANGDVYYWRLASDHRTTTSSGYIAHGIALNWRIVGATYSYGVPILIWEDTSGDVYYWKMNGPVMNGSGYVAQGIPTNWSITGTGDIFGDGTDSLLWRDSNTGAVYYWHMNFDGITELSGGYISNGVAANWRIVGTANVNGDGFADIIWENTAGDVYYWQMNGASITNAAYIATGVPPSWQIQATNNPVIVLTMPNLMQKVSDEQGTFQVLAMDANDDWLVNSTTRWATRGVPSSLFTEMQNDSSQVTGAAIDKNGNWVTILGSNGYQSVGIPQGLVNALNSIHSQGATVHAVALGPNGGYVVAYGVGGYYENNVPQSLIDDLTSIHNNSQTVDAIALSDSGGFVITYGAGAGGYYASGVPQSLITVLNTANQKKWTVFAVALGASNSYAIASTGQWSVFSTK